MVQYSYTYRVNEYTGQVSIVFFIGTRTVQLKANDWQQAMSKIETTKQLLDNAC